MIKEKDKLFLIKKIKEEYGVPGVICAIYNDIELKWYYYIGELKLKSPNEGIYSNRILNAKCINLIIDNPDTFFTGDVISNKDLLITKINSMTKEDIQSFDFKVVQF